LFEFHDKRHFMEFYLNFKMPFLKDVFGGARMMCPWSIMMMVKPKSLPCPRKSKKSSKS